MFAKISERGLNKHAICCWPETSWHSQTWFKCIRLPFLRFHPVTNVFIICSFVQPPQLSFFFSLSFLVTLKSSWQPGHGFLICWNLPINVKSIFLYIQMEDKMVFRSCFVPSFCLSFRHRYDNALEVSKKCVCYNTQLAIF